MARIGGRSGHYNVSKQHQQQIGRLGNKANRRIQQAEHTAMLRGGLTRYTPARPLSSYACIRELMQELPSVQARKHVSLSKRKAMLQGSRQNGG